jgi:hypothetical protein
MPRIAKSRTIKHFSYQLILNGKLYLIWFDDEQKQYMCTGMNGVGLIEFPVGFDAFDADSGSPAVTEATKRLILKEVAK